MFVVWVISYVHERRLMAQQTSAQPPAKSLATAGSAAKTAAAETPSAAEAPTEDAAKAAAAATEMAGDGNQPPAVFDDTAPTDDEATLLYRGSNAATIKPPPH